MASQFNPAIAPSLTVSDQNRLTEWNSTDVKFDSARHVHDLFDEQVLRTPDKTAVICRDQTLTYAALSDRADKLAHRLCKLGVGPDTIVAISMKRSLDMMVALFGVLKAGGAYLPLDPAFPPERVAFMLKDSDARVVLTQRSLKDRLGDSTAVVISIDESDSDDDTADRIEALAFDQPASSLAYLIYTSGSTGTPKGVMVEHRNVVNLFAGMDRAIGTEEGVWLAVTSISFDISVLELLWTLSRGFTVVLQTGVNILSETGEYSIAAQITRHGVTHFQCTPTLARTLIKSPETTSAMKLLRKLFLGGEALPPSLASQLQEALGAEIFNLYGPTETTVWSTTQKLTRSVGSVPIGKPIANTRTYIVDELGRLASIGAEGELCIGGAGVTRGYWQRPDLTAEKFVVNPFEPDQTGKMYRTGDLARYRENGDIEFIGRTDHQVKIRGVRIELGEIETLLSAHPAVQEAVVVARRDHADIPELAAYVVIKPGQNTGAQELRVHARQKLPESMIPSVISFLGAMPLTPNGKTDRNALLNSNSHAIGESPKGGLATTELEGIIAELWQDALGLDVVGLEVNFFDLGANSLTVAEVATSLRQKLKREIPLTDFFAHPTIAALAAHLRVVDQQGTSTDYTTTDYPDRGVARRQALLMRARARVRGKAEPEK